MIARETPLLAARDALAVPRALSAIVAVLLLVSSVAGLIFGPSTLYDPEKLAAWVGQDAVSLVVALPMLVGSLLLVRRGSARALHVWLGTLYYVVYGYAYYVFGLKFNLLFLVYVALVSLSLYALVWTLANVDVTAIRASFASAVPERPIGGYMVGIAVMFAVFWIGMILSALASGSTIDPVLRLVSTLDFLMPLPSLLLTGILLWQGRPWGYALGGLVLVKATATALTLLFNAGLALVWGGSLDPFVIPYAITFLGGLACAVPFFRSIAPSS